MDSTFKKVGNLSSTKPNYAIPTEIHLDMPKCWLEDHEKEISTAAYGRYGHPFQKNGAPHPYVDRVQYKIYVPLRTGDAVAVEVRFKVDAKPGMSATDIAAVKTKLEAAVNRYWNGKASVTIKDPACGQKILKIVYRVVWVTSGEHYTVRAHTAYPREGVSGNFMDVSRTTDIWTYAHEFAHTVGLPDEYSYTPYIETVKYFRPDGTMDAAISAPPDGKASTDSDATIMSAVGSPTVLDRHFWNIAIEVRDLLKAKLGRTITCDI